MKKLKFNSTLNHKQSDYKTHEVIVEKAVMVYDKSFSELKDHPMRDDPYIAENRDLMYTDSDDVAHCLLLVDYDSGDGILVESEGSNYARKSQFIPNARALVENNEMTLSEQKLHNQLKQISDKIAELAHCGEKDFDFEELLDKSDLDFKSLLRNSVVEMLNDREDIKMAEGQSIDVDFQPDITVEAKPTLELTFYCPLHIVREYNDSEYEWDEEVMEEAEEIPSEYAVGCADEINEFIQNYSEPEEEHRGLMVYFDNNPAVSEKVFSAIPSVKEIDGELMGVFECRITDKLTDNELTDLKSYLSGQASDGWGEGLEQHPIKTADYGEIYVSFWNSGDNWALQTEKEMSFEQTEDLSEEPELDMTM
ncbi:MAG: DUF6329 domain-containing protein [Alistipes sp.]|nr:DUF6329 domain-containing protein [Alistipes sp.]